MKNDLPFIGKKYKVIAGPFTGFEGQCVSYDLESSLPIILQDEKFNSRAVKTNEVLLTDDSQSDISNLQKN